MDQLNKNYTGDYASVSLSKRFSYINYFSSQNMRLWVSKSYKSSQIISINIYYYLYELFSNLESDIKLHIHITTMYGISGMHLKINVIFFSCCCG